MRSVLAYYILFLLNGCSTRSDIVFSACDELHRLTLYEQNKEFEMLYNGFNTVEGNYQYKNDTIFLTYASKEVLGPETDRHANKVLTRMIWVNKENKRIRSLNGMPFCGDIDRNKLK